MGRQLQNKIAWFMLGLLQAVARSSISKKIFRQAVCIFI